MRSSFIGDNKAVTQGGGIHNDSRIDFDNGSPPNETTTFVRDSTLSRNQARDPAVFGDHDAGDGGGISNSGLLSVTLSKLELNRAGKGGGIHNTGDTTISASTLESNHANDDGGGVFNSGDVTLVGSSVIGNVADDGDDGDDLNRSNGGGIANLFGGDLVLINTNLSWNRADGYRGRGGGIYNGSRTVGVERETEVHVTNGSIISNNSAYDGGGIFSDEFSGDLVSVELSTITENSAERDGGGMMNFGTLNVSASTFSHNSAGRNGGATATSGEAKWTATTVSHNSALDGGGIFNYGNPSWPGELAVVNSTLSSNTASNRGGGIFNRQPETNSSILTVTHGTLAGNSAAFEGGGVFNEDLAALINTIVANSPSGGDLVGAFEGSGNLIGTTGGGLDPNRNLLSLEPQLGPLADYGGPTATHALLPGSPAIDAGDSVPGVTRDQRYFTRPVGQADIGAFEFGATIPLDFGDAPDPPYPTFAESNGAQHEIVEGFHLGATVSDSPASSTEHEDDDGVVFSLLRKGQLGTVVVTVTNEIGREAYLAAWIDFDNSGSWDSDEQIAADVPMVDVVNEFTFALPADTAFDERIYARFRMSSQAGLQPTGSVADGEVEDYPLVISDGFNLGDPYGENAVSFSSLIAGQPASIEVQVTNDFDNDAFLSVWIDFDNDGSAELNERMVLDRPVEAGVTNASFHVPLDAITDTPIKVRTQLTCCSGYVTHDITLDAIGPSFEDVIISEVSITRPYDFGDAPAPYRTSLGEHGAFHRVNEHFAIGTPPDGDVDAERSLDANGDDPNPDSETTSGVSDGIEFSTGMYPGEIASVHVNVVDTRTDSQTAFLNAWVDFDANGTWSVDEQIIDNADAVTGDYAFTVPLSVAVDERIYARFRLSESELTSPLAGGTADVAVAFDGEVEDLWIVVEPWLDYGDAPDVDDSLILPGSHFPTKHSNEGARHRVTDELFLGHAVDAEASPELILETLPNQQFVSVTDDREGEDDEDGVVFGPLVLGETAEIEVQLTNTRSDQAYLNAWIDWDGSGSWDVPNEQAFAAQPLAVGSNLLTISIPETAQTNQILYTRFRVSFESDLNFATDSAVEIPPLGEVEDHPIIIAEGPYDLGDAYRGGFPTSLADDGARHVVSPGFQLGAAVDGDSTDFTSPDADGDDNDNTDDEDGVTFGPLRAGQLSTVNVWLTNTIGKEARLNAWLDFDGSGSWEPTEQIFADEPLVSGINILTFEAPAFAQSGETLFSRFRLSSTEGLGIAGHAADGEVEDHPLQIAPPFDFGDAVGIHADQARHIVNPDLHLGALVDGESHAGAGSGKGLDDYHDGTTPYPNYLKDDEDGVVNPLSELTVTAGSQPRISVSVTNRTGEAAVLYGWIDSNNDGRFDNEHERAIAEISATEYTQGKVVSLEFPPIWSGFYGEAQARFRLARKADTNAADPIRPAGDGEVEDYRVNVVLPTSSSVITSNGPEVVGGVGIDLLDDYRFGRSVAIVGDLDGNGVDDLAVGIPGDDSADETNSGAVALLYRDAEGKVIDKVLINGDTLGLAHLIRYSHHNFGYSVAAIGDLNSDGIPDLAVGAPGEDPDVYDGYGSVFILYLNNEDVREPVKAVSQIKGVDLGLNSSNAFGRSIAPLGGVDEQGIQKIAVGAVRDSVSTIEVLHVQQNGELHSFHTIGENQGGFGETSSDRGFGHALAPAGLVNDDSIPDLAVGDPVAGVVHVLMMNSAGTVDSHETTVGEAGYSGFGSGLSSVGDLNFDGVPDLMVTANEHFRAVQLNRSGQGTLQLRQTTGSERFQSVASLGIMDPISGLTEVVFGVPLHDTGYVERRLIGPRDGIRVLSGNLAYGGFGVVNQSFGKSIVSLGDIDGNGTADLAVGEGNNVHILMLQYGSVIRRVETIGQLDGFVPQFETGGAFGSAMTTIGDLDGNGVTELLIASPIPGVNPQTIDEFFIAYLEEDGVASRVEKLTLTGDLPSPGAGLGTFFATVGDLNRDGMPEVVVSADNDSLQLLYLQRDGTADVVPLLNRFEIGAPFNADSLAAIGDINADGVTDIAIVIDGRVEILMLDADGSVLDIARIDSMRDLYPNVSESPFFPQQVIPLGDLNGDGIPDMGLSRGIPDLGSLYYLLEFVNLNRDGTVLSADSVHQPVEPLIAFLGEHYIVGDESTQENNGAIDIASVQQGLFGPARGEIDFLNFKPELVGSILPSLPDGTTPGAGGVELGDAPDSGFGVAYGNYQTHWADNGPVHLQRGPMWLGETPGTFEVAANQTPLADGDYDDGIVLAHRLEFDSGTQPSFEILVTNESTEAGTLFGWIDANFDGVFDNETERASANVPAGWSASDGNTVTLQFPMIPAGINGRTYARFRISTDAEATANPTGVAIDGEVEDYAVIINGPPGIVPKSVGYINKSDVPNLILTDGRERGVTEFAQNVVDIGDLDGDEIRDLAAVSGRSWTTVQILFLNQDGSVKGTANIANPAPDPDRLAVDGENFGRGLAVLRSADSDDGLVLAVGASGHLRPYEVPPITPGAVYIIRVNPDGSVARWTKISHNQSGGPDLSADFDYNYDNYYINYYYDGLYRLFGDSIAAIDLDQDGSNELVVASFDKLYTLFLNEDDTVESWNVALELTELGKLHASQRTSVVPSLRDVVVATMGDFDGDQTPDILVGFNEFGIANHRVGGSISILTMNADGTVKERIAVSPTPNMPLMQNANQGFGNSLTSMGDLNGDGVIDIAVGDQLSPTDADSDGRTDGAVHVAFLNSDGTVQSLTTLSKGAGGAPKGDSWFLGAAVARLGDPTSGIVGLAASTANAALHLFEILQQSSDFGDAPDTAPGSTFGNYRTRSFDDGPSHKTTPNLFLGALVDSEPDVEPTEFATDDDIDGPINDEDGLVNPAFDLQFIAGQSPRIRVQVTNLTGTDATLHGWIDFDQDGVFESDDFEYRSLTIPSGTFVETVTVEFPPVPETFTGTTYARFRLSTDPAAAAPTGPATDGEVEDWVITLYDIDYGDAPASYGTLSESNGASHTIDKRLTIGWWVDGDGDGQPSENADADDLAGVSADLLGQLGTDDEDRVQFPEDLVFFQETVPTIRVAVANHLLEPVTLYGWIDADGNGALDSDERATTVVQPGSYVVPLTFPSIPDVQDGFSGRTYARFRVSSDAAASSPIGHATDGEVEDYEVLIYQRDLGDAPDPGPGTGNGNYRTLVSNFLGDTGPEHRIDSRVRLGDSVDHDTETFPNTLANGDDTSGQTPDDEDGLINAVADLNLELGDYPQVRVNVTNETDQTATLYGWIDYNGDGAFTADERATSTVAPGTSGAVRTLYFYRVTDRRTDGFLGTTYARFRISTDPSMTTAFGYAADGEVEDYVASISPYTGDSSNIIGDDIVAERLIDQLSPDLLPSLDAGSLFGKSTAVGHLDDDGVLDVVVGAYKAIYVLLMNYDGSIKESTRIDFSSFVSNPYRNDFVRSVAIGHLNADGNPDIAVGSSFGFTGGAVHFLFMNQGGLTFDDSVTITNGSHHLAQTGVYDRFGSALAISQIPDPLDITSTIPVVAVGASGKDNDQGAVYLLYLERDGGSIRQGAVLDVQAANLGGLFEGDQFGADLDFAHLNPDVDEIPDLVVGRPGFDLTEFRDEGAVHLIELDQDGAVVSNRLISTDTPRVYQHLGVGNRLGLAVAVGDLNGDNYPDIAVGNTVFDRQGFVQLLILDPNDAKVEPVQQRVLFQLNDDTRYSIGYGTGGLSIGDLDGNGHADLIVGDAHDGSDNHGTVRIQYLNRLSPAILTLAVDSHPEVRPYRGFEVQANATVEDLDEWLDAIATLTEIPRPNEVVTILLTLASGTYNGREIYVPNGYRLVVNGQQIGEAGEVIFIGASPALTVLSGEVVITGGVKFTNETDAPTILVQSGSLTLRNTVVEESTVAIQPAIQIVGGSVDLGTTSQPGGNTITIRGEGNLIANSSPQTISAVGNTFQDNETPLQSNFDIEDKIIDSSDGNGGGKVTVVLDSLFFTIAEGIRNFNLASLNPDFVPEDVSFAIVSFDGGDAELLTDERTVRFTAPDEGDMLFQYTIWKDGEAVVTRTVNLRVRNQNPWVTHVSEPVVDAEGHTTISGTVADPGSADTHTVTFDFGIQGIGGNRNANVGDGYYELNLDLDGDGTFETTRSFHRLFGDVNGDRRINALDWSQILSAYGTIGVGLDEDVNGDGVINALDRIFAIRANGRSLIDTLLTDD